MGLDATIRTIDTDASNPVDRYLRGTVALATFRKFHPLHTWIVDNIAGANVSYVDNYPVIVEAELSANDIKRAYAHIADMFGVSADIDNARGDDDLVRLRNVYKYAIARGADTPCVYYGGDC